MTRARKNTFVVIANNISGKAVSIIGLQDGDGLKYDLASDSFLPAQFALQNHDHEIGDITLIFENQLI